MKMVEPIPDLKIYFEDVKGTYQINEHGAIKCTRPFVKDEKKMTREEAINKLRKIFNCKSTENNLNDFVDGLEALGLLKFEEEVNPVVKQAIEKARQTINTIEFVKVMEREGYKIVPIDK